MSQSNPYMLYCFWSCLFFLHIPGGLPQRSLYYRRCYFLLSASPKQQPPAVTTVRAQGWLLEEGTWKAAQYGVGGGISSLHFFEIIRSVSTFLSNPIQLTGALVHISGRCGLEAVICRWVTPCMVWKRLFFCRCVRLCLSVHVCLRELYFVCLIPGDVGNCINKTTGKKWSMEKNELLYQGSSFL